MSNPTVQFEWLFETLNKRVGAPYNIPINELFLCVPYPEESEFEFELSTAFNNFGVSQGIVLERDYPNLYKILGHDKKSSTIKVFLLKPNRIKTACVLWHRKFAYPKISRSQSP